MSRKSCRLGGTGIGGRSQRERTGVGNVSGLEIGRIFSGNSLVFSSLEFLFRFLPASLLFFYVTPVKYRKVTLFFESLFLYACCEPLYVSLLLALTLLNYLTGRRTAGTASGTEGEKAGKKGWLILSVGVDLGVLVFFKAGNLLNDNLLLPLGISFYSFKLISWQADCYRGKTDVSASFWQMGAYICMFPQVASGPIMRYEDAREALSGKRVRPEDVEEGLRLLILGLLAKVLLADRLGILWADLQTIGFESISTPLAWLGAFTYSLQLYFDFEGYSLMAVGIGRMMGLPYLDNFRQPYMAVSVSDFWRRWHITLGSWFRDYVYIPLGGNRKGRLRQAGNLAVVWILTGLWHGNGPNFLLWGMVLGSLIIAEKLFYGGWMEKRRILCHVYVWLLLPLTWMIFAIPDLNELGIYFARLFPFFGVGETLNAHDIGKYLSMYWPVLAGGIICCVPGVCTLYEKWKRKWFVTLALALLFWAAVFRLSNAANNPFLYFRF